MSGLSSIATTSSLTERILLDKQEINNLVFKGMSFQQKVSLNQLSSLKSGEQQSVQKGSGMDFDDMRIHQYGEDPKYIDWRASARSQHMLTRTFYSESNQSVCLVIDRQASMRFGTKCRLKVTQAVRVALWFAGLNLQVDRNIAAVLLDAPCQWMEARGGYDAVMDIAEYAVQPSPPIESDNVSWKKVFSSLRERLDQGSQLILVSDFLSLSHDDVSLLRSIGQYFDVKAIQVIDPFEKQLEKKVKQITGLQLVWNRVFSLTDDKEQLQHLVNNQKQHEKFLKDEFKKSGITYKQVLTDKDDFSELLSDIVL